MAISVSRPRLAPTTRKKPFDRLRLVNGASAPATLAGAANPAAAAAKGGRSMSSVTVGLTRMARVGMKRPRTSSTRDRSSRAVGAERRLTPPASSRRASTMRRLGQGRAEKVAACGALQCRRGEAPKAAFKLSPTLAADNGQRANPHAASARMDATAQPHATARRMLGTPPSTPSPTIGCAVNDS